MKFKFKKGAPMQGTSSGFWYDIKDGGYIKPEEVLADPRQVKTVKDALEVLSEFESQLEAKGLLEEF